MDLVSYVKSYPVRSFKRGDMILAAGDDPDEILAIRDGFIGVSSVSASGRQQLVWIAGRYDLFPNEGLFQNCSVRFFYTGLSDGSMYCLDKADFLSQARSNPEFMAQIALGLSEHFDDLLGRVNAVQQADIRTKIICTLSNLCRRFTSSPIIDLHEIGLPMTHQLIADMIGASRESASLELKKLQNDGLIAYSRSSFTVYADKLSSAL